MKGPYGHAGKLRQASLALPTIGVAAARRLMGHSEACVNEASPASRKQIRPEPNKLFLVPFARHSQVLLPSFRCIKVLSPPPTGVLSIFFIDITQIQHLALARGC
jgi:hypothetical protein